MNAWSPAGFIGHVSVPIEKRFLVGCFLAGLVLLSIRLPAEAGISLTKVRTKSMSSGTHRPEILVVNSNELMLVVVEPEGAAGVGQIKHKAYRLNAGDLSEIGDPFTITTTTSTYGEPADHRATIVSNQLVVVYQNLIYADTNTVSSRLAGKGPSEDLASEQSLLFARFSLTGQELLRTSVVAHVTNFFADNFPDHCLVWHDNRLLISTGSYTNSLKIREVDFNGAVLNTHVIQTADSAIAEEIGNSLLVRNDTVFMLSTSGDPAIKDITLTRLSSDFLPAGITNFSVPGREDTFPTGPWVAATNRTYIGHISRADGGSTELTENPYYPYLMVLDSNTNLSFDIQVGTTGSGHVHPTLAMIGNRLFVAWSMSTTQSNSTQTTPQVMIEEYAVDDGPVTVPSTNRPEQNLLCDYDGDGTNDMAVYAEAAGQWYVRTISGAATVAGRQWGGPGHTTVPGDFDGDGSADLAVYHEQTGRWFVLGTNGAVLLWGMPWGGPGFDPLPGDYDGDGLSDLAVFDATSATWYIATASGSVIAWAIPWGLQAWIPVYGDPNGDGKSDMTVYDALSGCWYSREVAGPVLIWNVVFGGSSFTPVSGDYNGDGHADMAVYQQATGLWYVRSLGGALLAWAIPWGGPGLTPVPGDFDGDGSADLAVYHEQTGKWFIRGAEGSTILWDQPWGGPGFSTVY